MTKFSIALGVGPREPMSRVGTIAKFMEENGFHAMWVQDNPLTTKDAYIALTVAALSTERLVLAPGVTNTVIRHPSVIVNSVSSLDNLVPGRTILGIGGGGPSLLMPLGFKVGRASEFKEDLRSIMTLTNGGQVTLSKEAQYGVNSALHPIPVYVAASGPIMLGLTGELADGVVITGAAQKDTFAQKINLAREGATKSGKDTNKLKINLMITVAVDSNRDKALTDVKPFAAGLAASGDKDIPPKYEHLIKKIRDQHDYRTYLSSKGTESQLIPDDFADFTAIAGGLNYCLERIHSLIELKPDEITFRLLSGGKMQRLESLASLIQDLKANYH